VVSWNIRKAVGLDWRRDPARILRCLDGLGADVVVLQEADKRLPPRPSALPAEMLRAHGWTPVVVPGAGIGSHGNAILMGPGVEAGEVAPLDLPGLEPRGALLARLGTPIGTLVVCGLHLGLTRGARLRQLTALRDRLAFEARPVLMAGDFNERAATRGFEPLADAFEMHTPGPSFHARSPMVAFDRFATRGPLVAEALDVPAGGEIDRASDHLPVRAVFSMRRGADHTPVLRPETLEKGVPNPLT
jgi:endonuclease/exonuclease/phosphatase family metal-dependent hydrolase